MLRWLETHMQVAFSRYFCRLHADVLRRPHDILLLFWLHVDLLVDERALELGCVAVTHHPTLVLLVDEVESRHYQIMLLLVVILTGKSAHHILARRHQSIAAVVKMSVLRGQKTHCGTVLGLNLEVVRTRHIVMSLPVARHGVLGDCE